MKLYIANATKQVNQFWYTSRLANGTLRQVRQDILEGSQIQIQWDGSGIMQPEDIDYVVEQHAIYGLMPIDEIDNAKPFTGLCYSIDKPIPAMKIQKLMLHNQDILETRAEDTLRATALASNKILETNMERTARDARQPVPAMGDMEISITEESKGSAPSKTNFFRPDPKLGEGNKPAGAIKVSRTDKPRHGRKG
jgi:hypothetical protein